MNFFEEEVAKLSRRVKNIAENPIPGKLKSNKLLYELDLDLRLHQMEAWQQGRPFAEPGLFHPLLQALGFEIGDYIMAADRTSHADEHFDTVRTMGYPDSLCDRTIVQLAMLNSQHMPPPALVVMHNNACEAIKLSGNALGRISGAQIYAIDVPVNTEERPQEVLTYVTAQLRGLIDFVEERFPGHKFDEELFTELLEADRIATQCCQGVYEARKAVPCPVDGRDAFRELRLPSWFSNWRLAVQYFLEWRDEMVERAEKGISGLKEEKLRFLWTVSGPFYFDPFPLLTSQGVAVPYFHYGMGGRMWGVLYPNYGEEHMFQRELTPLEEMARFVMYNSWAGLGTRWLTDTLRVAQDLKVNGIINFIQVGCTAISGLNTMLAQSSERELGIPTLNIEGRMLDATFFNQTEFETRMGVFIDTCLSRKAAA